MPCRTIDAHAEGGPVRLLVEGVPLVEGATLAERAAETAAALEPLRRVLCREPRGHRDLVLGCLAVPEVPSAHAALLFFGEQGLVPWCGHGLVAALTIAVERGLLLVGRNARETLWIESLAGVRQVILTSVTSGTGAGRSRRVSLVTYDAGTAEVVDAGRAVACGSRRARVDLVRLDGRVWAVLDAEAAGLPLSDGGRDRARAGGVEWIDAIDASLAATGIGATLEAVVLTGPPANEAAHLRTLTVFGDGTLDVSPGGGATVAVASVLAAMGVVGCGDAATVEGLLGGRFEGRVRRIDARDGRPVVDVSVAGRAWITGEHTWHFAAGDPLHGLA